MAEGKEREGEIDQKFLRFANSRLDILMISCMHTESATSHSVCSSQGRDCTRSAS